LFLVPFHGTKLLENRLVRMMFSPGEMGLAGKNSASLRADANLANNP
jgi:hypothetical protein